MTQNLIPTSDISSIGLLNEIGTRLPLWTSINGDQSTFLKPISGLTHVEAKFRTFIPTFGRGNVSTITGILNMETNKVYKVSVVLQDRVGQTIATNIQDISGIFNFSLDYQINDAASFDLGEVFMSFSIDSIPASGTSILDDITKITSFSINVVTIGDGLRQSGKCAPCNPPPPCFGLTGAHRLYFHDLSNSGIDSTGNCSSPIFNDNKFEYYGEHLIHKQTGGILDFGVASVDLGQRHILTYDDTIVQLNGLNPCETVNFGLISQFQFVGDLFEVTFTTNNTVPPIFSDHDDEPPREHPECLVFRSPIQGDTIIVNERDFSDLYNDVGVGTTNKAGRDREYHINSVNNDNNIYNIQQNFNDIYIDFLHTDNSGNKTYFDGHHLFDHYTYRRCEMPSSLIPRPINCNSADFLPEETVLSFTQRVINTCRQKELTCAPVDPNVPPCLAIDELFPQTINGKLFPHGFIGGEHTYHDHRITFALSAKVQLWTAPKSGRHHDNIGGYDKTNGVGLFFRNDLGSGIAFMPINNMPLSSGLIGFVDNANNFTPLDIDISGSSNLVFRDSDELTMGISEQTTYRVIRPVLPVDRLHSGFYRSFPSTELQGGEWEADPNFLESGTFVEIVRGHYELSVSMLGHCFHEAESASFVIPSGLFSSTNPPTDVGICGFGGFQAKDLCVNYSHIREHILPYHNHVVRTSQLCDSADRPDFGNISERIIIPPDDPSLYEFKGCFNE